MNITAKSSARSAGRFNACVGGITASHSTTDWVPLIEPVARRLLGEPNDKLSKLGIELRFGSNGSKSINLEKGQFYDHEKTIGGGVLDLIGHVLGCDQGGAVEWLKREGLIPDRPRPGATPHIKSKIVCAYDYCDENGSLLHQTVRYEPKSFRQRRPDPDKPGEWLWNIQDTRTVLYRLPDLVEAIADHKMICLCEGEKDCDNLIALGVAATTSPMGSKKWKPEYSEMLRGADVVIIQDNDDPGRDHANTVAAALNGNANRIRVLDLAAVWPECPDKGDISDWIDAGGTADRLKALTDIPDYIAPKPRLKPCTLVEFLSLPIKPREMVLDPIIPEKGLAMLYATRGIGKTHLALGIAYAVATGTGFLRWRAPKPRRVLLIDGEMPARVLQERLAKIITGTPGTESGPDMLQVLCGDLIEEGGVGNLASPDVQNELGPWLDDVDFLILDNLSSLTAVLRDNDAESWGPIQDWLLRLRRRGVSVLIVHHAGKGGQQRGTSRREDVLDTSISLRRPQDYNPAEGARFEVHLEKARGVHGDAAKPFEARYEVRNGAAVWTTRDVVELGGKYSFPADPLTIGRCYEHAILLDGYHRAALFWKFGPHNGNLKAYMPHAFLES
jgi:putative DNA primase/helicase